jgi:hypothetical protein
MVVGVDLPKDSLLTQYFPHPWRELLSAGVSAPSREDNMCFRRHMWQRKTHGCGFPHSFVGRRCCQTLFLPIHLRKTLVGVLVVVTNTLQRVSSSWMILLAFLIGRKPSYDDK